MNGSALYKTKYATKYQLLFENYLSGLTRFYYLSLFHKMNGQAPHTTRNFTKHYMVASALHPHERDSFLCNCAVLFSHVIYLCTNSDNIKFIFFCKMVASALHPHERDSFLCNCPVLFSHVIYLCTNSDNIKFIFFCKMVASALHPHERDSFLCNCAVLFSHVIYLCTNSDNIKFIFFCKTWSSCSRAKLHKSMREIYFRTFSK